MTDVQAHQAETLFRRQEKTRDFMDYVAYNEFLNRFGVWAETKRIEGQLVADEGKGFLSEFCFQDGSIWRTAEVYMVDDSRQIAFERRPVEIILEHPPGLES